MLIFLTILTVIRITVLKPKNFARIAARRSKVFTGVVEIAVIYRLEYESNKGTFETKETAFKKESEISMNRV